MPELQLPSAFSSSVSIAPAVVGESPAASIRFWLVPCDTQAAAAISLGVLLVDLSAANTFTASMTANVTGFNISNIPGSGTRTAFFTVLCTYDGTAQRTLPASGAGFKYAGGTAPVLPASASERTLLSFVSFDAGSLWLISGQRFS